MKGKTKSYRIYLCIIILLFPGLKGYSQPPGYDIRNFSATDGLENGYIYSIIQDDPGYLWIGTGDGLYRYNGLGFESFTTSDSLADNFVTCGIKDNAVMWFGHINGTVSFFNGKDFREIVTGLTDPGPTTHLGKSPDNTVWMSTYNGNLLRLNQNESEIQQYSFRQPQNIISFAFTEGKGLLIGTDTGLLLCSLNNSGEIITERKIPDVPESKIVGILKMKSGKGFYVATENEGVFSVIYHDNNFGTSILHTNMDMTGIQSMYEDNRSDLWICTFGNGIIKISPDGSGMVLNTTNGYLSDNVKTIFGDRDGNIWCGSYGEGLTLLTLKSFRIFTFDETRFGNNISSVYAARDGLWAGTEKGLLKLDPDGKFRAYYGKNNGLPEDKITALAEAGNKLWLGTENNGLYWIEIKSGKIFRYPIADGPLQNSITSMAVIKDRLWIGTKRGLCRIEPDKYVAQWFSISQGGLPHNYIYSLFADRSGRLWVSSKSRVLAYIVEDKVFKLPINHETSALSFVPFIQDPGSLIWVGSLGAGVYRIAPDTMLNLTTRNGLYSDFCYAMGMDDEANIWISHKGGLSRISTGDFFIKPVLPENQHLNFNPNAMTKDGSGVLWMGSETGLISYDSRKEQSDPQPLIPHMISVGINDEEIEFRPLVRLKHGSYKFRLEYFAVSLKEPELTTYKIKLEGHDLLSELTKSRVVTYNLKEGKYTFNLQAISGDGIISTRPLLMEIIIQTPVWKQWWFYPAIALLLMVLIFMYIKRSRYLFQVEKSRLEKMVLERTQEIQNQKNEIEQQNDIIRAKNAAITSSIQYAMNIQTAVLPAKSILENLLPEYFVFLRPKDIVSGDFYWISKKDDKVIFTVADCTGHGVPGAFMSLLSINILNEIVNIQGITRSDEIVNMLQIRINQSLNNSKMDGMDLSLCVWDPQKGELQYTGAMNHLIYIRDGELELVRADQFSVNSLRDDFKPFTMKIIDIQKGDMFYLHSDGYMDQFGGIKDKKYTISRFYDTLLEIHQLSMTEQEDRLDAYLKSWKNGKVQTDDITVMGIRF